MKKYKIIILLVCLILLSGCTINYNLTIDNNIQESITINDNVNEDNSLEDITNLYKSYFPVYINENYLDFIDEEAIEGRDYYNKSNLLNENSNYSYSLSYSHKSLENFQNTQFWNYLLTNNYIDETDDIITIWTGYGNKLFNENYNVTNLNIKITTSLKVLENNADKIEGNSYIWEYTKDNYYKKNISLKLEKESKNPEEIIPSEEKEPNYEDKDNSQNNLKKENNLTLVLGFFGIFLILLIIILKFLK